MEHPSMSSRSELEDLKATGLKPQLQDYAFTTRGFAMLDGRRNQRQHNEIINAHSAGSKGLVQLLELAGLEPNGVAFRNDLRLTDKEKSPEAEEGSLKWMIIGYAPRELLSVSGKEKLKKGAPNSGRKNKAIGNEVPKGEYLIEWNNDKPPVMAVVPCSKAINQLKVYGLINEKNDLYRPFPISTDFVFYLPEFRDDSEVLRVRQANWTQSIINATIAMGETTALPPTEKQNLYRRAKEPCKLVFNPNVSVGNEIACLGASYMETKKKWFLAEMSRILEQVDKDLESRPSTEALRVFTENPDLLDDNLASDVAKEFKQLWPSAEFVDGARMQQIKKAMVEGNIFLPYRLIRPFIVELSYRMQNEPVSDLTAESKKVLDMTLRLFPDSDSSTAATPSQAAVVTDCESCKPRARIIDLVIVKLKEIVEVTREWNKEVVDFCGDSPLPESISEITKMWSAATDQDTISLTITAVTKFLAGFLNQESRGTVIMLRDLIAILEQTTSAKAQEK